MENLNNYKSKIYENIERISNEVIILKAKYSKFFNIEEIFSSENGGKTRIHRQIFNENHENIQASILEISLSLDEILGVIRDEMKVVLDKCNQFNKTELLNLIFDDKNFLSILSLDLETYGLDKELKTNSLSKMRELINLKNKIFNLKYFIDMFDTTILDRYINKLGIEDLINSTIIFEIIDSYALQFEEVKKFSEQLVTLDASTEKITYFNSLISLLELHKRRVDNYTYAGIRYKIFLDYSCKENIKKPIFVNKVYIEHIVSALIEQSCMDVVKKELKKGKIQKQIDVDITFNKGILQITIKNNGFEVRNVQSLFLSDMENKYILDAKNLTEYMNGKFEVSTIDNEGMSYSLFFDLKNNTK